jgi:hypothetical protein
VVLISGNTSLVHNLNLLYYINEKIGVLLQTMSPTNINLQPIRRPYHFQKRAYFGTWVYCDI